jgi:hypothetical protein
VGHYQFEMRRHTVRHHGRESCHEPAERPFLFIQVSSLGRSRKVKRVPSRQPKGDMLDDSVGPRVRSHTIPLEQDARGRIISRSWADTRYAEQQQLPAYEEAYEPSQVRLGWRDDTTVFAPPRGRTTDARGRAEVSLDDLEHGYHER